MIRFVVLALACAVRISAQDALPLIQSMSTRPMWVTDIQRIAQLNGGSLSSAVAEAEVRCLVRAVTARELPRSIPADLRQRLERACVRNAMLVVESDVRGAEVHVNGQWYPMPARLWVRADAGAVDLQFRAAVRLRASSVRVPLVPGDSVLASVSLEAPPFGTPPLRIPDVLPEFAGRMQEPPRVKEPAAPAPRSWGRHLLGWTIASGYALWIRNGRAPCAPLVMSGYGTFNGRPVEPGDEMRNVRCEQVRAVEHGAGALSASVLTYAASSLLDEARHDRAMRRAIKTNAVPSPTTEPDRWVRVNGTPEQVARWRAAQDRHKREREEAARLAAVIEARPLLAVRHLSEWAAPSSPLVAGPANAVADGVHSCAGSTGRGLALILAPVSRVLGPIASLRADHAALVDAFCRTGHVASVVTRAELTESEARQLLYPDGLLARRLKSMPADAPLLVAAIGHSVSTGTGAGPRLALEDYNSAYPQESSLDLWDLMAKLKPLIAGRTGPSFVMWLSCFSVKGPIAPVVAGDVKVVPVDPTLGSDAVVMTASDGPLAPSWISTRTGRQFAVDALVRALDAGDADGDGRLSAQELERSVNEHIGSALLREREATQRAVVWPKGAPLSAVRTAVLLATGK